MAAAEPADDYFFARRIDLRRVRGAQDEARNERSVRAPAGFHVADKDITVLRKTRMKRDGINAVERLMMLAKVEDELEHRTGSGHKRIELAALFEDQQTRRAGQGNYLDGVGKGEARENAFQAIRRRWVGRADDAIGSPRRPRGGRCHGRGQEQSRGDADYFATAPRN